MAGGVVRKAYEAGAGFAEGRARRPEPVGRLSLEWVPGVLLVVLGTAAALVLLRAASTRPHRPRPSRTRTRTDRRRRR